MTASKSIRKQVFMMIWDAEYAPEFGADLSDHISNYVRGIEPGMTYRQMCEALSKELDNPSYHCGDHMTAFASDMWYQTELFMSKYSDLMAEFGFDA